MSVTVTQKNKFGGKVIFVRICWKDAKKGLRGILWFTEKNPAQAEVKLALGKF